MCLRLFNTVSGVVPFLVALILSLASPVSPAGLTYTGDITLTTDYVSEGVSQTGRQPAVQGSFGLDTGVGLELGVWASNVDFGSEADLEMDFIGSFGFDVYSDLVMEVGLIHYNYLGEATLNYNEIFLNIGILGLEMGLTYSDDYGARGSAAIGTRIGYGFPLLSDLLSLGLEYGQLNSDDRVFAANTLDADNNFSYWGASLVLNLVGSELRLSLTDSNQPGCGDDCGSLTALSWSRSF